MIWVTVQDSGKMQRRTEAAVFAFSRTSVLSFRVTMHRADGYVAYVLNGKSKKEAHRMEFLKVEDLCKVYGKGESQVTALDHVSLTIEKGEFTAIIGSSGSGKSTLLHIIAGVDMPTSGKVYLNGQDVYAQSNERLAVFRRRQVGLVYQFHNLVPTLNVVENITLPILMDKRKVNRERLNDLLELLGLEERRVHLPNQLSGGQQQRVAIGRALMNAPQVMLADEPTGSLDSRNGHEIVKLLKESNKKYGQTLVLVTHDENIALQADRIITIADGKVVRDERQVARE